MSILKTTLLAVSLAFVAASSANAATTKAGQAFASVSTQSNPTNQWSVNSSAPYSREGNERFTW